MNIEEQALKIAELREKAEEVMAGNDFDADAWMNLKHEEFALIELLQKHLLDKSSLEISDPKAAKIIREIDLSENENLEEEAEEVLYSWFSIRDYARNLALVNALVSPVSIPTRLKTFVEEARQCYALGQSNAVYSLSRTILETAVNDIGVRIGRLQKRILDEDCFQDYPFSKRLGLVASGEKRERIYDHYRLLCRLVHGGTTVGQGEALEGLLGSLAFVAQLYAIHRHAIDK